MWCIEKQNPKRKSLNSMPVFQLSCKTLKLINCLAICEVKEVMLHLAVQGISLLFIEYNKSVSV